MEQKIIEIIAKTLGISSRGIKLDSHLEDDLGADSLDGIEIMLELEDEFSLEIPTAEAKALKYVGDVVNYIEVRKELIK